MSMIKNGVSLKLDEPRLVAELRKYGEKLNASEGDVVLDFASVRRVDPAALTALTRFVDAADAKSVKVELRDANIDVYRVLKLARLAGRFYQVS